MKHTKGKWLVNKIDGENGMHDTFSIIVKMKYGELLYMAKVVGAKPSDIDTEDAEMEANANLMASAPEMLELLKQLRFDLSKDDYYKNHVVDIDSIIAKAEGK